MARFEEVEHLELEKLYYEEEKQEYELKVFYNLVKRLESIKAKIGIRLLL